MHEIDSHKKSTKFSEKEISTGPNQQSQPVDNDSTDRDLEILMNYCYQQQKFLAGREASADETADLVLSC